MLQLNETKTQSGRFSPIAVSWNSLNTFHFAPPDTPKVTNNMETGRDVVSKRFS